MKIAPIAEAIRIGHTYTDGTLHIHLNDGVRERYTRHGSAQDGYEFVIEARRGLKVKRAGKDGKLMSFLERLRYGPFAHFAVITNQPSITNLLPSLIALDDARLTDPDVWRLLTYDLEWKVESSERFYLHFLRGHKVVSEFDVLATIAGAIRAETMHYLRNGATQSSAPLQPDPLTQATLDEQVVPKVNQRIASTGITVRRFYRSRPRESQSEATTQADAQATLDALLNLRHAHHLPPGSAGRDTPLRSAIVSGLLSHLCQELSPDKQWLEQIWRVGGFDMTFDEIRAALAGDAGLHAQARSPIASQARPRLGLGSRQRISQEVPSSALAPAIVVQKLKDAGREQLRAANRTTPQELQRRGRLRQKALTFCELALVLGASPILADQESTSNQNMRFELFALVQSLREPDRTRNAQMAFRPGSTIHLMAVAAKPVEIPGGMAAGDYETVQLVQEILPLVAETYLGARDQVTVWTPAAAAKQVDFVGSAEEINLMLQVVEPNLATTTDSESMDSVLFWTWKVRASREQFSIRLRSTNVPTMYDVELQDAEFIDTQPSRSSKFPELPHIRLKYEPLELALLIDGYWLAGDSTEQRDRRTGLNLLIKLLDGLDEIENLTKRGLLIHAAICLDDHISKEFLAAYGSLPCLYTLGDAPIETTAQLVAEWLQPWVDRWNVWEIKPYPVDTDIALEQGFRYLRQLRWQRTTRPAQRAILAVGRSRPHDHAKYFADMASHDPLYTKSVLDRLDIPYHPLDRFSVTDIDWREELRSLRESTGAILALCDPGLPNPRYRLSTNHVLFREYQDFWATVDPGTRLDIDEEYITQCAEMGIDRVLQALDTQLFQRRAVRYCQPPLALPCSQTLAI